MILESNLNVVISKMESAMNRLKPILVSKMAATALFFINENFDKGGYQGVTLTLWQKTKKAKPGHKTLEGPSGNLKRSPFPSEQDSEHARITSNLAYSKIHNEGGEIRHPYREVSLYYKGNPGSLKLGKMKTEGQQRKITTVRHSSIYNHVTKMPQRQFMPTNANPSPVLNKRIADMIRKETIAYFKIIG